MLPSLPTGCSSFQRLQLPTEHRHGEASGAFLEAAGVFLEATGVFLEAARVFLEATEVFLKATGVFLEAAGVFLEAARVFLEATGVFVEATGLLVAGGTAALRVPARPSSTACSSSDSVRDLFGVPRHAASTWRAPATPLVPGKAAKAPRAAQRRSAPRTDSPAILGPGGWKTDVPAVADGPLERRPSPWTKTRTSTSSRTHCGPFSPAASAATHLPLLRPSGRNTEYTTSADIDHRAALHVHVDGPRTPRTPSTSRPNKPARQPRKGQGRRRTPKGRPSPPCHSRVRLYISLTGRRTDKGAWDPCFTTTSTDLTTPLFLVNR
ncbi:proteoglycan 4-like [Thrips palmi]|uniref:Proteoglycan 4-like n=1 Tax=Thrips palmi TaxID=161013 RepID=A0A6P8Z7X1_THRPL|nr:proteoglycan 4-like [Thrips palmi]